MKRIVCLVGCLFAGSVNAAFISNSSDPSLSGATVIDFESQTISSSTNYSIGDVTFSNAGTGSLQISNYTTGGVYGTSGLELSTRYAQGSFNIDFASPVSAFGMIWGAANPNWNVDLFDSSNNLIESLVFLGGNNGASFIEFYGARNSGIAKAQLTAASGYDWVKIDDFQYVTESINGTVPEPTSFALIGLGFAGISLTRKKKIAG